MHSKELKKEQVELLQKVLNVDFTLKGSYDDEVNSKLMECEIFCDCLQFGYNFGLPEWKLTEFLKFFHGFIKESVAVGLPIEKAMELLKNEIQTLSEAGTFSDFFLKSAVDYICNTLIQHYYLYMYVLCHERMVDLKVIEKVVQAPPYEFDKLAIGVPHDTWILEEMLKEKDLELHQHNEEVNRTTCEANKLLEKELNEYTKTLEDLCPDETSLAELTDLVKRILQKHSDVTATELNGALERSKQSIICAFEKSKISKSTSSSSEPQSRLREVKEKRSTSSKKKKNR